MIRKLRVTVDGKPYDVMVEMPDQVLESAPAQPGMAPVVAPPVAPVAPAPAARPAPAAAGSGDVASLLAGRVAAIVVQVGQQVKTGDHLITLEAMKMNTLVVAPRAGKVTEINVAVGAVVDEGQALARVE
jgi:glutaconyl-CoA/methylmalonyl-CoA decarboxylase subunit gamma